MSPRVIIVEDQDDYANNAINVIARIHATNDGRSGEIKSDEVQYWKIDGVSSYTSYLEKIKFTDAEFLVADLKYFLGDPPSDPAKAIMDAAEAAARQDGLSEHPQWNKLINSSTTGLRHILPGWMVVRRFAHRENPRKKFVLVASDWQQDLLTFINELPSGVWCKPVPNNKTQTAATELEKLIHRWLFGKELKEVLDELSSEFEIPLNYCPPDRFPHDLPDRIPHDLGGGTQHISRFATWAQDQFSSLDLSGEGLVGAYEACKGFAGYSGAFERLGTIALIVLFKLKQSGKDPLAVPVIIDAVHGRRRLIENMYVAGDPSRDNKTLRILQIDDLIWRLNGRITRVHLDQGRLTIVYSDKTSSEEFARLQRTYREVCNDIAAWLPKALNQPKDEWFDWTEDDRRRLLCPLREPHLTCRALIATQLLTGLKIDFPPEEDNSDEKLSRGSINLKRQGNDLHLIIS